MTKTRIIKVKSINNNEIKIIITTVTKTIFILWIKIGNCIKI